LNGVVRADAAFVCTREECLREGKIRPGASPGVRLSEELPELVAADPSVAQDPSERAPLEFTMKRDHQRNRALVVFEPHMATAVANSNPSIFPSASISR
jgi:hypothetical protein